MNAALLAFFLLFPHTPKLSQQDKNCIAYAVWYEARGESVTGQRAVMDVIVNRSKMRKMTACEVIKQPFQFSFYKNEKIRLTNKMMENFKIIYNKGVVLDSNVVYYHAYYVSPKWARSKVKDRVIGHHIFYGETP